MEDSKIVFMGTADFSTTVFKALIAAKYKIVAVVTQPDRQVGRKKVLTAPDLKIAAEELKIPVLQPERIKDSYQEVLAYQPDIIITAAYGQIIPKAVLEYPKRGCINVHASLLPKYRGGAPVHYAILNGETETGVTIMQMVAKMDAGDIIQQAKLTIGDKENVGSLYNRLAKLGADLLVETMPVLLSGQYISYKQDETRATYSPIIKRADEKIDWAAKATTIANKVRGLDPWPGAYTVYEGKNVKLWAGDIHDCPNAQVHHSHQKPGTIVKIFSDAIGVKTGDLIYLITELQVEGKKRMSTAEYLRGHSIFKAEHSFE